MRLCIPHIATFRAITRAIKWKYFNPQIRIEPTTIAFTVKRYNTPRRRQITTANIHHTLDISLSKQTLHTYISTYIHKLRIDRSKNNFNSKLGTDKKWINHSRHASIRRVYLVIALLDWVFGGRQYSVFEIIINRMLLLFCVFKGRYVPTPLSFQLPIPEFFYL